MAIYFCIQIRLNILRRIQISTKFHIRKIEGRLPLAVVINHYANHYYGLRQSRKEKDKEMRE